MMKKKKRIGLMSCGSNTPGINAAIRAAARTIFKNGAEVVNIQNGFDGLMDIENISLPDWTFFQGLLFKGGSVLGLPRKGDPFSYPIIRDNRIEYIDKSDLIIDLVREIKVDSIVMIGGVNDILIARKLSQKGINFHIIPNCIVNDFTPASITFGFKTAVETACQALDRLHTTAESHHRVFIVEVIGDHSGWIALESGITGGADVILVPEIPFDLDNIVETLEYRKQHSANFSLIVVASGARPSNVNDDFDGDVITLLINELQNKIELEIRSLNLKLIQLGGGPIAFDRLLATNYGYWAATQACNERINTVSVFTSDSMQTLSIEDINLSIKTILSAHLLLDSAKSVGISFCNSE